MNDDQIAEQADDSAVLAELYGPHTHEQAAPVPDAAPTVEAPVPDAEPTPAEAPVPESAPEAQPSAAPMPAQEFILKALEEFEARKAVTTAPAQEPQEEQPVTLDTFLSAEDKAAVAALQADWPDIAAATQRMLHANTQMVQAQMRAEFNAMLQQQVAPVQQVVQQQAAIADGQAYWAAVSAAHPDVTPGTIGRVGAQLSAWINTQPAFLRAAYAAAAEGRDPAAAIELLNVFKASSPATQPTTPPKPAVPKSAVAATAAPPRSTRQQVSSMPDPNDQDAVLVELYGTKR